MSKRKASPISKAPKIQAAAPASTLPATTGKKRGRPAKASQAAPQAATAQGNGTTPHTLPAAASAPTGVLLRVGEDTTLECGNLDAALAAYNRLQRGGDGKL